jgi:predicted HicB family RNase H-like nuclease
VNCGKPIKGGRPRVRGIRRPSFDFRMEKELRADLQALAALEERSLGHYVELVLRKHRDANLARVGGVR